MQLPPKNSITHRLIGKGFFIDPLALSPKRGGGEGAEAGLPQLDPSDQTFPSFISLVAEGGWGGSGAGPSATIHVIRRSDPISM